MALVCIATVALGLAALAYVERTRLFEIVLAPLFIKMDAHPVARARLTDLSMAIVMRYSRICHRKGLLINAYKHVLDLLMPPCAWYALHSVGPAELSAKLVEASGGKEITLRHLHWGKITYIGR
jgi:hypothetical protein